MSDQSGQQHWGYALESFTPMASLAAVTTRIKLFASTAVPTLPPAIVASMATTIESVAPGRFGVNIVSGWQLAEYDRMGLWPGNGYFGYRYDCSSEYVHIMTELWSTGSSDYEGARFTTKGCMMTRQPSTEIRIIAAGRSERGMTFAADYADFDFALGSGIDTPTAFALSNKRLMEAAAISGRDVGAYVPFMIIADETDERAEAKWQTYKEGADPEARAWMADQGGRDGNADPNSTARKINLAEGAANTKMTSRRPEPAAAV